MLKAEQRQKEPQLSLSIVDGEAPQAVDRKALRGLQKEMKEILDLLSASPSNAAVHPIRALRTPRPDPPVSQASDDLFR